MSKGKIIVKKIENPFKRIKNMQKNRYDSHSAYNA